MTEDRSDGRCIWGNLTIGGFIDELLRRDPKHWVCFDFCYRQPSGVSSYRGHYDHLAIEHRELENWDDMLVEGLLEMLEGALGKRFGGWKGGEYLMTRDTPLWVDNPGDASSTGVMGIVEDCDHMTVVRTAWVPS